LQTLVLTLITVLLKSLKYKNIIMFLGKACLAIINHPHRFEMGKKHPLFSLPMHFKNENKLADMVDILCEVEETLNVLWQRQEPKQMMSLEISFYVISAALLVEIN